MVAWIFLGCNIVLWLSAFLVEKWEFRVGRMPERKKWQQENPGASFLYLTDWHTGSWGDLVGLSLVAWSFGESLVVWHHGVSLMALVVSLGVTAGFHRLWWRNNGVSNSGYPKDRQLSLFGKMHLVYTAALLYVSAYLLFLIMLREASGTVTSIALFGGALYGISFLCDYREGKFSVKRKC